MSLADELLAFVRERLADAGVEPDGELTERTPLLSTRLVDSHAVLALAVWVEERSGIELDLGEVDFVAEWDTVGDIARFVERARGGK
jgi:acyl carrier protein